jgi:hypothetical protein
VPCVGVGLCLKQRKELCGVEYIVTQRSGYPREAHGVASLKSALVCVESKNHVVQTAEVVRSFSVLTLNIVGGLDKGPLRTSEKVSVALVRNKLSELLQHNVALRSAPVVGELRNKQPETVLHACKIGGRRHPNRCVAKRRFL